ncbi:MAG TPA: hypothetical protein VIF62_07850 [Labilithrix sp.]|jgi:hypothetical protein
MKRRAIAALAFVMVCASNAAAREPTADEVERARTFFNAGAQAYSNASYKDAARSFEQAYALAPRPQLLFSLAQAERKEGLSSNDASYLKRAVQHYKEYLDQVPTGGRRSEATEAKADLESRLARMDPSQTTSAQPEKRKARVTVWSPTPGARVSLDGGPPEPVPYFSDLETGKHKVRVFADGYFDEVAEVSGDAAGDQPLNMTLRDKPALVSVVLASNADIYVDGRIVATAPVDRPIEVAPGPHVLSVSANGRKPLSHDVVLERGKPFRFEPKLETSGQRIVSYGLLGGGAVGLVGGAIFGVLALGQESRAKDIDAQRQNGNISAERMNTYNRSIDQRDAYRTVSIIGLSAGATLAAGGVLLWAFDKPPIAVVPPRSVEPTPAPRGPTNVDIGAYPVLGPGFAGAGVGGRF